MDENRLLLRPHNVQKEGVYPSHLGCGLRMCSEAAFAIGSILYGPKLPCLGRYQAGVYELLFEVLEHIRER